MDKDTITLIGGLNSLGVPYTRDNSEHIGFFNIVENYIKSKGYDVRTVDMFRLNKNHTWDFEKIFSENTLLSEIKDMQIKSISELRAVNPLFKLIIPKNYVNNLTIPSSNNDQSVLDIYTGASNPVFIYSCGPNDFFSFIGAGPVEILDKNVRGKMPKNYTELILKAVGNVKKNLILLNQLNFNVKIMVIGMSDTPLYYKIECLIYMQEKLKNKDLKFERKIDKLIAFYNNEMAKMCSEFKNIEFVDISIMKNYCAPLDFHPNKVGNELIAEQVIEKMDKHLEFNEIDSTNKFML